MNNPTICSATSSLYCREKEKSTTNNVFWFICRPPNCCSNNTSKTSYVPSGMCIWSKKIKLWVHGQGLTILTRDNIEVLADTVGYLLTTNAPVTEMSTVQEILHQTIVFQSLLHLENIAVFLDQPLFSKATEIALNNPDNYESVCINDGKFLHYLKLIVQNWEKVWRCRALGLRSWVWSYCCGVCK